MSLTYNESYDRPAEPQLVRDDFDELIELSDSTELLRALAGALPTDVLAEFIDDRLMGRI